FGRPYAKTFRARGERTVSAQGDACEGLCVSGSHNVINVSRSHPAPQPGPPSPLHQLPADIADFAGRGAQVEKLMGVLSAPGGRAAISAIDGMGGLGKTTLAVPGAHRPVAPSPGAPHLVR